MAAVSSRPLKRTVSLWRRPLLVGVCFGVGYGLTLRLLDLRFGDLVQWGPAFEVRDTPGTSLESLRLRFGSAGQALRGVLDLQQLQQEEPTPAPQDAPATPEPAQAELPLELPSRPAVPVAPAPAPAPPAPELPPAPVDPSQP
jgi:hypothetical protein